MSKRVDARSQRETRYMKSLVKKYSDVLSGKATVVNVGRKTAKEYSEDTFRPRFGKIVVPKKKGEHVYFDKKSKQVITTRKEYGQSIKKIIRPQKEFSIESLPKPRKGKRLFYRVPFNGWTNSPRFEDLQELKNFMSGYEASFPNWQNHIEIEEVDVRGLEDDDDADF